MRLRTQITLGVVALSFATFVAVGYVAVVSSKHVVRDGLDAQLLADIARDGNPLDGIDGDHSVIVIDSDGTQTVVQQPPAHGVASIDDVAALPVVGQVDYLDQQDATVQRVTTVALDDGRTLVAATDASDVTGLVEQLSRRFWIIGLSASSALGVLGWWWIRRSTRPIELLIGRAGEIASGSPDRTLTVRATTTELRQLTDALNDMVTSIDAALAVRIDSEARIRSFVADASHELRTPLTTISGYLQLDADGALAAREEHDRSIHRALSEARRMHRLVADLQLLAELDETPSPLATDFDLGHIVGEAVDIARAIDPDRTYQHQLVCRRMTGDPDQIRQVIDNLIGNARRHTPPGTRVDIDVEPLGDSTQIRVSDNGPGISDADLPNVFQRFWHHDRARSRTTGGSGLGLAIVSSIVELHGGTIHARHAAGGGLAVHILLPTNTAIADTRHDRQEIST
jgi:two-component system OmpR family sensor kinase